MNGIRQAVALGLLVLAAVPCSGEVLDKIVVVVNDKFIITLSDIQKERTIQRALGTDLKDDDSAASALVDKYLIEEQMARYRIVEIPEERIEQQLQTIKDPGGLSPEQLRQAVTEKLRMAEFFTQRFGPFIRVSDDEIKKYYEEEYAPGARRSGLPVPTLEQAANDVRQILIRLRINNELETWMTELLGRTKVEKVSK